jgi:hypothetical protein
VGSFAGFIRRLDPGFRLEPLPVAFQGRGRSQRPAPTLESTPQKRIQTVQMADEAFTHAATRAFQRDGTEGCGQEQLDRLTDIEADAPETDLRGHG